jgi:hypothetical protein
MKMEPTAKLRFVERTVHLEGEDVGTVRVLQQWWAEPMPAYMRNDAIGEWRDIPMGVEAP